MDTVLPLLQVTRQKKQNKKRLINGVLRFPQRPQPEIMSHGFETDKSVVVRNLSHTCNTWGEAAHGSIKNMCGWTFDKAADRNTETEGLNQQPFSYWTRRPTDFPDTFLLFTGARTSVFTTRSIKTEVQLQNFKPTQKKKKKKSADLSSYWTDPQSAQKLNGGKCLYPHRETTYLSLARNTHTLSSWQQAMTMNVFTLELLACCGHGCAPFNSTNTCVTSHGTSYEHVTNNVFESRILTAISWVCAVRLSDTHLFISSTQVHSSLFQCSAWGHQGGFYVINLIERWRT